KVEFSYLGHVDLQNKARFNRVKPVLYWGISQVDGAYKLTKASNGSLVAYSPLVGTTPKIEEILSQSYTNANVANGKFGGVEEFIPVDFSN
ncbi:MAG: hypothetical protein QNL65_04770, partial [Opitutales bacterium]